MDIILKMIEAKMALAGLVKRIRFNGFSPGKIEAKTVRMIRKYLAISPDRAKHVMARRTVYHCLDISAIVISWEGLPVRSIIPAASRAG
jgi:hypothetical protein